MVLHMNDAIRTDQVYIGTTEAARILDKSPRTIHRMVAAGTLTPALHAPGGQNGAYLFHRSDIESYAVKQRQEVA